MDEVVAALIVVVGVAVVALAAEEVGVALTEVVEDEVLLPTEVVSATFLARRSRSTKERHLAHECCLVNSVG